jgi:hypothetical protein
MFEVLLRADRALASGALDEAERSFWQLMDLDPTNSIAVTGLALVSMERGDLRLARTFVDRALAMDPESAAATRILQSLNGGAAAGAASDVPDLLMLAALRLEALGRQRAAADEDEADGAVRASGQKAGRQLKTTDDDDREQLPQLPTEPLSERRQVGRQAAATAAAIAAAAAASAEAATSAARRPQPQPRPKSHQALGGHARRLPLSDDLKPQWRSDPFAAAESAAAIEAVDETDDVAIEEPAWRAGRTPGKPADELSDALEAADATDEDESIAMRVALVADGADLDPAELAAATFGAIGARSGDESITMRLAVIEAAAEPDAAEPAAVEPEAAEPAAAEPEVAAPEVAAPEAAAPDAAVSAAADMPAAEVETPEILGEELDEEELDVAEMVAAMALGRTPPRRIDLAAVEADLRAAELRAAEREARESGTVSATAASTNASFGGSELAAEPPAAQPAANLAAAEPPAADPPAAQPAAQPAANLAAAEPPAKAEPQAAESDALGGRPGRPVRTRQRSSISDEPTEGDAEAAALREAVAMVLGVEAGEEGDASGSATAKSKEPVQPAGLRPRASGIIEEPTPELSGESDKPDEPAAEAAQPADPGPTIEPRRKGFLRRFRGD